MAKDKNQKTAETNAKDLDNLQSLKQDISKVVAEAKEVEAEKAEAEAEEAAEPEAAKLPFDKMVELIKAKSPKDAEKVAQIPEAMREDIADLLVKALYPAGLKAELETDLKESLPKFLAEKAKVYGVTAEGLEFSCKFPDVLFPTEKAKGNGKKGGGSWGKVAVVNEKQDKLGEYTSLNALALAVSLSTEWKGDMFEGFTKEGWKIIKRPASRDGSGVTLQVPAGVKSVPKQP